MDKNKIKQFHQFFYAGDRTALKLLAKEYITQNCTLLDALYDKTSDSLKEEALTLFKKFLSSFEIKNLKLPLTLETDTNKSIDDRYYFNIL